MSLKKLTVLFLGSTLLGFLVMRGCNSTTVDEEIRVEYYPDIDGDRYGDPHGNSQILYRFLTEEEEKGFRVAPIGRDKDNVLLKDESDCHDNDRTTFPCSTLEGGSDCGIPWPQCH